MDSNEYKEFEKSYDFEIENHFSHFVNGDISCHAGNVSKVLEAAFYDK